MIEQQINKFNYHWGKNRRPGLGLTLISPGYFGGWVLARGGGLLQPPPPPLQISAVDKICIKVECDVNYNTVLLDYSLLSSFILYELIMLIYAKNSYFHYNSLLIFGTYILFNILSNCALKNFSIEINFSWILLFYEFLMYLFVFSTFCFLLFFPWNLLQPLSQALSS